MSGQSRNPAVAQERAELAALREQAAQTRREAAQTLTVLADKIAARDPRAWARRGAVIGGVAVAVVAAALIAYRLR